MRASFTAVGIVVAALLMPVAPTATPAADASPARTLLAPQGTLDSKVRVDRQVAHDGTVRGVLTNVSSAPIEDITIAVEHSWVWSREWNHEGDPRPAGDLVYHQIGTQIPPGGQVQFAVEPSRPLPIGRPQGGHYVTSIDVVSLVQRQTPPTRGSSVPRGVPR